MENLELVVHAIFSPNSIWSVVARGVIWLLVAVVIIVSTDAPDPDSSLRNLKANLGFFLMFLILSGGLVYLLFSYVPAT